MLACDWNGHSYIGLDHFGGGLEGIIHIAVFLFHHALAHVGPCGLWS